ncbi:MAG: hypothetical protein WCP06_12975 [Verrucomicrobiota bacterium]
MKPPQFYIAVALGAVCLVLSIAAIALGQSNQRLQAQLQSQQDEINFATANVQQGQGMIRDMAQLSVKNDKIKQALARNGINVTVNASPTPSPTPAQ